MLKCDKLIEGWIDLRVCKSHYQNGLVHRDDGPAVVWPCGSVEWFKNGKRHREDGPAVIYVGKGLRKLRDRRALHNQDRVVYFDPDSTEEFWLNGENIHPVKFFVNQKLTETEETA